MIIHDVTQGSPEWFKLRIGIPTASEFDKIITPARGELSKSWKPYAARLIWEKLINTTTQSLEGIKHVEEGKRLEPFAVRQFEIVNDVETRKIGFVTTDDGLIGASPDRFIVGQPRCVEIKCPTGPVHMRYALFGHEEAYKPQIQGQLEVCEREEGVFYSYVERAPAYEIRTQRDDPFLSKMRAALREFNDNLQMLTEKALAMGQYQAFADIITPLEAEYGPSLRDGLPDVEDAA
jgi:hypothetical protein